MKNYQLINTLNSQNILNDLSTHSIVAYDTETTGLNVRKDKIIGISFSYEVNTGYYLPLYVWNGSSLQDLGNKELCLSFLHTLKTKKLIMHNGSFDIRVTLNNFSINLLNSLHADTQLMKHTINEEGPFALKDNAVEYAEAMGFSQQDIANQEQLNLRANVEAKGGSWTKENKEMYKADLEVLYPYACADADLTLRLYLLFNEMLQQEGLTSFFYNEEVMPLYKYVTIKMEHKGLNLDMPLLTQMSKEIAEDITKLKKSVIKAIESSEEGQQFLAEKLEAIEAKPSGAFAQKVCNYYNLQLPLLSTGKYSTAAKFIKDLPDGEAKQFFVSKDASCLPTEVVRGLKRSILEESNDGSFINISSKQQLGHIVFDILGIKPLTTTQKGSPQLNEDMVEELANKYKLTWAKELRIYNKLMKIKSSYYDVYVEENEDGIFYPYFAQHKTTSGRYGSNIQQLSKPLEEGSDDERIIKYTNILRALFISKQGYSFIGDDYESLEPRCFSDNSSDNSLLDVFKKDLDFYSVIAIMSENIVGASADKKSPNFLKKINPQKRQDSKCFARGTVCIVRDSKDSDPYFCFIENIKVGQEVSTQFGFRLVTNVTKRTVEDMLRIGSRRGGLLCTTDHKIWSIDDNTWKEAKDFKVGDVLNFKSEKISQSEYKVLPVYTNASLYSKSLKSPYTITITKEWGWIIGAFLGDGVSSYARRSDATDLISSYVGICGLEEDGVVDHWKMLMENFGFSCRLVVKKGEAENRKDLHTYLSKDFEAVKLFQTTFGLMKHTLSKTVKGCKNLHVPEFILNSPLDVKLHFFAGLVDTDGWVSDSKIGFCTKDFQFANQVMCLLWSMGIIGSLESSYNKTYKKYYYKVMVGLHATQNLLLLGFDKILACKRKSDKLLLLQKYNKLRQHPNNVNYVESVKGNHTVFDVTVDDVHEFLANGLRVHNCYALGIRYGMKSAKLSKTLKIEKEDAEVIIQNYFKAFPGLYQRMQECLTSAKKEGKVFSKFGRIRHLPRIKEIYNKYGDEILEYKNLKRLSIKHYTPLPILANIRKEYNALLNNALNFPIQSTATSIVNRAAIAMSKEFVAKKLDAWVCAQIHDELIISCNESQVAVVSEIVERCMETTNKLSIPLIAKPTIAKNFKDTK